MELDASAPPIKYKVFEYVVVLKDKNGQPIKDKDGRDKKRIKEIVVERFPADLFADLAATTPSFIQHTFRAKWQDDQFCELLENFPVGDLVFVIDFAENYSLQVQDEIKSMHWHSDQITLLVHITLRHKQLDIDGVESTEENRQIAQKTIFYISDDRQHDTLFVRHCLVKRCPCSGVEGEGGNGQHAPCLLKWGCIAVQVPKSFQPHGPILGLDSHVAGGESLLIYKV